MPISLSFTSGVFPVDTIDLEGRQEQIVKGGRHLFPLLPKAFEGVRQIGVIGWGSQGPAQAQNLRDSLQGSDIKVKVGLRPGSSSMAEAREAGFNEQDGTLGEMFAVISESDLVVLLISDAAQAELYEQILAAMKPGATLGLSHGFLIGHMKNVGATLPEQHQRDRRLPQGHGAVRAAAVRAGHLGERRGDQLQLCHRAGRGRSGDRPGALGWSVALGSPFTFQTTLESEYKSDIYGERGILLGAVHGIIESLYRRYVAMGMSHEDAFRNSAESITGPISRIISKDGMKGVYEALGADGRPEFESAYSAAYPAARQILAEIYDEVSSGNEIRSVILAGERLKSGPMGTIDGTETWKTGERVRAVRNEEAIPLNPFTAGVYIATMMAQIDILIAHDHPYSEVANESVIEAVDSLNPYMHARGVAYMVDNCSTTARLGSRKWAPRFDYILTQDAYVKLDDKQALDESLLPAFREHDIHDVLAACAQLRPSVDIFVE